MHQASVTEIKLLVVDIDGTIAGESNTISESVKQALAQAQAKGIQIAVATGRMYCSALPFHQEIGSTLPLVAYQGAWIQDPATAKIHRHLTVPEDLTHKLLDYFEQPELLKLLSVHFYINDQLYVRELTTETETYAQRSGVTPIAVGDLRSISACAPTKILALCDDTDVIDNLLGNLRQKIYSCRTISDKICGYVL